MAYYYITTPIYYVNDVPHIGHAYTTVTSDVLARFMRLNGKKVKFLTGTDEHGQKVEKSAEKAEMDPQSFTDKTSLSFRDLFNQLNISNDDFIRTTEERHKIGATALWQRLVDSGDVYLGSYAGWYAVRDEAFYNESELTPDGLAPTGAPVEWVEEPSYFFALSKWQDKLLEFYEQNPDFIRPASRRNEIISFVKSGLTDLSVSRTSFKWGIPIPSDKKHVMYVWLDALSNYINALGFPNMEGDFNNYWQEAVHIVGKDILRFHTVYWPAFLMAAGLDLPKMVFAHGWWTNEGQKISKSLGNVINPCVLIDEFGCDYVRYYLNREVIFGNDGNFSREGFINRINSELVNKIGNLSQRTLAFIAKNLQGTIPDMINPQLLYSQEKILANLSELFKQFQENMDRQEINAVMDGIIRLAEAANSYIDVEAPWNLRKTNEQRMNEVLYCLVEVIRHLGIFLLPFIPTLANKMLDQIGVSIEQRNFAHIGLQSAIKPGTQIETPTPIFNRLDN